MPTIEEMKNEWPHIKFELIKNNVLDISFGGKFVQIEFVDTKLSLSDFKIRLLDPILYAIEIKIKREEIRKRQNVS